MTWLVLWHPALLVLAGLLCGRYLHHHHVDQVERDAWDDGFTEALRCVVGFEYADDSERLDAAQEQTAAVGWPGWNQKEH